mgnify:CR=1 FL=1
MKMAIFILVTLFLIGCNNNEQSLLVLIKEKDQKIEQLKKKNAQILEEIDRKSTRLNSSHW